MTIFGLAKPTMFGSDGQAKPGLAHFADDVHIDIDDNERQKLIHTLTVMLLKFKLHWTTLQSVMS